MKVVKIKDSFTELEKKQMVTINKLQEEIKLLEFDKAQNHATIRDLKTLLYSKQRSIKEIINEIEKIEKNQDYSRLLYIKKVLGIIERQGINNE